MQVDRASRKSEEKVTKRSESPGECVSLKTSVDPDGRVPHSANTALHLGHRKNRQCLQWRANICLQTVSMAPKQRKNHREAKTVPFSGLSTEESVLELTESLHRHLTHLFKKFHTEWMLLYQLCSSKQSRHSVGSVAEGATSVGGSGVPVGQEPAWTWYLLRFFPHPSLLSCSSLAKLLPSSGFSMLCKEGEECPIH